MDIAQTNKMDLTQEVRKEFASIPVHRAQVHTSQHLQAVCDFLLEHGHLQAPIRRRRQGERGKRSARNYLLRQALWYIRIFPNVKVFTKR